MYGALSVKFEWQKTVLCSQLNFKLINNLLVYLLLPVCVIRSRSGDILFVFFTGKQLTFSGLNDVMVFILIEQLS